ncbi:hypothetical protein BD770DRAFT_380146 [Pilaira anomala]|nr:hypothetical protein BD770DRAFT_380146 [Pilaira anomala]
MQVHSGLYYGEMYNSSSNAATTTGTSSTFQPQQPSYQETNSHVGYHRSLNKRRHSDDDDDEVDSYYSATSPTIVPQQSSDILVRNPPVTYSVRLPPPLNYQPSLSESSSTSTTSSICSSNSSPKINTIQTLLNNVKQEDFKYHHRPSAFSTVEVVNRSY